MTEDQNDPTNDGPTGEPNPETAPTGVPETTSQVAIPLPAVTPSASEQPRRSPSSPTPPRRASRPTRRHRRARPRPRAPMPWAPWPATRCWAHHRRPRSALPRPPTPGPPCGRRPRRLPLRVAAATTAFATVCWLEPPRWRSSAPASVSAMQRRTLVAAHRPSARRRAARACPPVPGPQAARTPRGVPAPRGAPSATATRGGLRRLRQFRELRQHGQRQLGVLGLLRSE